ncbi:hypothetical protein K443DRAFT_680854 [Laccaria amethystina LaAM-08-1]|uniref:Ubiquitin carboxyl-terminal hydrolase n=1 Tax=Laccaria amethystina LaAM-08-1 TaxID=1095629 RepID=A0A0C9XL71_9AGAR|nr:hypothetical protein K443DRAFT_680854 [Laccaria amethystina LaAM-08-1]
MPCTHLDTLTRLQPPRISNSVHREECTQCFDNQDGPLGVDVCLSCFNGGCLDPERHHSRTHVRKSGHPFSLNIKRKLKPSAQRLEDEEPPAKMKKLAIVEEREEDKYDHVTVIRCWRCDLEKGSEIPDAAVNSKVKSLIDGVMQAMSSARQSEVKAWEEEITACEHTLSLEQFAIGHNPASGLAHCNACDLKENLWLCMICGSLGCGRQQFGGVGGNGHGLAHFDATHHPVSVKLGTITPEGNADVYCYVCGDSKQDPEFATHLSIFGINVQTLKKTEKSMTELQIEQDLSYDFSLVGDDGKALEPVFGPGLTGLANLGNSCYMASVLQTLFSLPEFQTRYGSLFRDHSASCTIALPADCLECQMHKVADGLLSGRYSHPAPYASGTPSHPSDPLQHPSPTPVFQQGIRPTSFKALIGKGHPEFSTMKQQDSEEFFTYLVTTLRRDLHKYQDRPDQVRYRVDNMDVVSLIVPATEKGKNEDGKTIYEDVLLTQSLESLLGSEALEYACPSCQKSVIAVKQAKFASFPDVLVVHTKKYQTTTWVPTKLDIPLILPADDEVVFTENHLGLGLKPGEEVLPDDAPAAAALPQFNEAAMAQLEGMGFPTIRCQKALLATGNSDAEAAMEWLSSHMDDTDIDEPIQAAQSAAAVGGPEPSPDQIAMLSDMGFTVAQARKALRETSGNAERAVEWLFNHPDDPGGDAAAPTAGSPAAPAAIPGSKAIPARFKLKAFISHKGLSVHSGHYVAHIRVNAQWLLFNDEKVVKADDESVKELKKLAYLYFFERV